MNHLKKTASLVVTLLFLVALPNSVRGQDPVKFERDSLKIQDQLQLKSGASLSGIVSNLPDDKSEPVSFESSTGDTMLIDRELIAKIEKVDSISKQYNNSVDKLEDNAQSHRDIIAWCEEQDRGRSRFRSQILFHRKRVMLLDPNDRATRTKLGYTFLKDENRWVNKDQFWSQQGYNKKGDSTLFDVTEGELAKFEEQMKDKRKKFGNWQRNLGQMSHAQAVNSLVSIADPQLMPEIYKKFSATKDRGLREVYAEVFATARPTTSSAIQGLVTAVMDDRSDIALDYLRQEDFNRAQISIFLTAFLKSTNNRKINRAGFALGELRATNAVLALSKALRTKHQVSNATQQSGATRTQGNAGGTINQFGGQAAKSKVFPNGEVLGALKKITGEDFGYSAEAYQNWYVQNFTHVGLKARRSSSPTETQP